MRQVSIFCAALMCAACSKSASPAATGPGVTQAPDPHRESRASAGAGAESAGERPAPAAPAQPPAESECEALLDHFMDLALAAHARTVAPEVVPTAEQVAAIRADLAPEFLAACRELDRATYECEMTAQTKAELVACSAEDSGRGAGEP